jgi:hypothetical protein
MSCGVATCVQVNAPALCTDWQDLDALLADTSSNDDDVGFHVTPVVRQASPGNVQQVFFDFEAPRSTTSAASVSMFSPRSMSQYTAESEWTVVHTLRIPRR